MLFPINILKNIQQNFLEIGQFYSQLQSLLKKKQTYVRIATKILDKNKKSSCKEGEEREEQEEGEQEEEDEEPKKAAAHKTNHFKFLQQTLYLVGTETNDNECALVDDLIQLSETNAEDMTSNIESANYRMTKIRDSYF